MNEKVYTAWFPECCAPTLITRDMPAMHAFLQEQGRIVCKPLHGMGGKSIFVIETGDKNAGVIFETLTAYGSQFAIVQRYLPEIAQTGDARVILVDGEPVPFALARIPRRPIIAGTWPPGQRASAGRWTIEIAGSPRASVRGCVKRACFSSDST
jgi:glutathione synthase